jgi:hypothetical protein
LEITFPGKNFLGKRIPWKKNSLEKNSLEKYFLARSYRLATPALGFFNKPFLLFLGPKSSKAPRLQPIDKSGTTVSNWSS